MTYVPSAFVSAVRRVPVSALVTVTTTAGTAAPEESVIVPVIRPEACCAHDVTGSNNAMGSTRIKVDRVCKLTSGCAPILYQSKLRLRGLDFSLTPVVHARVCGMHTSPA